MQYINLELGGESLSGEVGNRQLGRYQTVRVGTRRSQKEEQRTPIENHSPSDKLVYKTLEYEGPLTQKKLVEQTRLSARTVRKALSELEDKQLVEERIHASDARQRLYVLAGDE